jgi:uncharacterized protein YjbI with pentapeptide repeats
MDRPSRRICRRLVTVAVLVLALGDMRSAHVALSFSGSCHLAPGADCSHANLSHQDLSNRDLTGINLSHANLTGAELHHDILNRANLTGATMTSVKFLGSQLEHANLNGTKLESASAHSVNFAAASMDGTNLSHSDLTGSNFYDTKFTNTDFAHATVKGASFIGAQFHNVNANGTDFYDTNLKADQFRVNVAAARPYYDVYIHIHANFYGKCRPHSGCTQGIGECSSYTVAPGVIPDSASNDASCTGIAESVEYSRNFKGSTEMTWQNHSGLGHLYSRCEAQGYGFDRLLLVRTLGRAWICGLIDRRWYWAIMRWGNLDDDDSAKTIRSGIDLSKKGEPGGAFAVHLGFVDHSSTRLGGYVLGLTGWVHVS